MTLPPSRAEAVGRPAREPRATGRSLLPARRRLLLTALLGLLPLRVPAVELLDLAVRRQDGALVLDYGLQVSLPRAVEDALRRGVPLYFETQATVYRPRWYWRDERVARQSRQWRLSYQPLTDSYRLSLGALHQTHARLADALATMTRTAQWHIAEAERVEPDEHYYVEWFWRLDTSQLPRPMLLGIGNQAEWQLGIERTLRLN